jgi:hypothetical protein
MNKKNLFIVIGAAAVGWFLVDTLSNYPGFKQVASSATLL